MTEVWAQSLASSLLHHEQQIDMETKYSFLRRDVRNYVYLSFYSEKRTAPGSPTDSLAPQALALCSLGLFASLS